MPFRHSLSQAGEPPDLGRGREAYERRAWAEAYTALAAADRETPLSPEDLERLATAAHLIGKEAHAADLLARAHRGFLEHRSRHAPRAAPFGWARGCWRRARWPRPVAGSRVPGGFLTSRWASAWSTDICYCRTGCGASCEGDCDAAAIAFARATAIGQRFADRDLVALGIHGQGRALIRLGRCRLRA